MQSNELYALLLHTRRLPLESAIVDSFVIEFGQ